VDFTRLPALDGLRGLAVLLVIAGHIIFARSTSAGNFLGLSGVSIFFVLSGFLITRVLLLDETRVGRARLARFYYRRALRILPALSCFLLVVALLSALGVIPAPSPLTWLASCFYFRNVAGVGWDTKHLWSLSIEEQFYLVWPLAFVLIQRRRRLRVAGMIIIACIAWKWITQPTMDQLIERLDLRIDTFLIGAAAALGLRSKVPIVLSTTLLAVWSFFSFAFPAIRHVQYTVQALLIIAVIDHLRHNHSAFTVVLCSAPLRMAGKLSYSLYLWQQLLLGPHLTWWSVSALLLVASGSYYLVEQPFLRLKDPSGGAVAPFSGAQTVAV